jgi:hypothetical protein
MFAEIGNISKAILSKGGKAVMAYFHDEGDG